VLTADPDAAARRIAAVALGELGSASPNCLPVGASDRLRWVAGEAPEHDLRRAAKRALGRLEGRAPGAPQEGT